MPEHLRRITIPTADGSRHELVIPRETDYGRVREIAAGEAREATAPLAAEIYTHSGRLWEYGDTLARHGAGIRELQEGLARLRFETVELPVLVARLVALGYDAAEAAAAIARHPYGEAAAKVALREGLASIGYTPTEMEECMEDVPALTEDDIAYARGIMEAWNPETTSLYKTWHGDTAMVVFPKIDFSNVTSVDSAWGDCQNLRFIPLLDTSGVTRMVTPFLGAGGIDKSARLRRVPAFDYSSLTSCNGVMSSFLPELEIVPPVDFPKLRRLMNVFANCFKLNKVPPITFPENVTAFNGLFMGDRSLDWLPVTDVRGASNIDNMYAAIGQSHPGGIDLSDRVLHGTAPQISIGALFQQAHLSGLPELDFKDVNSLSYFLAWCDVTPRVIPDFSRWGSVKYFKWFLWPYSNTTERVEGLNFASATEAEAFNHSFPRGLDRLRYIRIINLGQGPCAIYPFQLLRYWGDNDEANPDALRSLVDTLLTDSYDRAAAGMPVATVRLHRDVQNRLTDEQKAAITAKGFTITN